MTDTTKRQRTVSEETRAKISESMKGKRNAAGPHKLSDAGRAAISQAQRERWTRHRRLDKLPRPNTMKEST